MKVDRIAGILIIPSNMLLSKAQEGSEVDIETGGCILRQTRNIIFFQLITIAPDSHIGGVGKGNKGRGIILLVCRRSKRTRPCISCRPFVGYWSYPGVSLTPSVPWWKEAVYRICFGQFLLLFLTISLPLRQDRSNGSTIRITPKDLAR